ncbi:M28 family metallopeptidase [Actinomadura craniellae]|nr:M28 family metallopeptidase [Actinomadura craniellae]
MRGIPRRGVALAAAVILPLTLATPAQATPLGDLFVRKAVHAVNGKNLTEHLKRFQQIADAHGGTRSRGTPGYDASVDYVAGKLRKAGYRVRTTAVEFPQNWTELSPPVLSQTAPEATTYTNPADYVTVVSSGSGDVTAQVQGVDLVIPPAPTPNTSTSGCQTADFDGFVAGRIALIQRGTCPFIDKARNAKAAGAAGVIFFNEGQPGRTDPFAFDIGEWRLGFPVVFASTATGLDLADPAGTTVRLKVDARTEVGTTRNVIADSPRGRPDNVVMVGAHLDSVPEGPGLNDNATGSAAILETALKIAKFPVRNRVRFAFWGAEEAGLLGSTQYVEGLPTAERNKIRLYLNFDMVGSPNYAYKIYDGDDSDATGSPAGPPGSAQIEKVFEKFYDQRSLGHVGTDFDGRSDYGPFIAIGIPAGGLFTGAEGLKTPAEAQLFGGQAGVAYDVCYHLACDTLANVNTTALDVNADAIATATVTFAFNTAQIPPRTTGSGRTATTAAR